MVKSRRPLVAATITCAMLLISCGASDEADETTQQPAPTSVPDIATTAPVATAEPAATAQPTAAPAATVAPTPTTVPEFAPPATIVLDDVMWAQEPEDVSYRASLEFSLRAEFADGTVQEGVITGTGGKLTDPTDIHSMVIVVDEFGTIPSCVDLATVSPNYTSAYFTFWGGLSSEEGGDLTGQAQLLEAGVQTNGVVADRYAITLDNIDPEDADEYVNFDTAFIDIARDGEFVVRVVLNGLGYNNAFAIDQSEPRFITYDLNFSEFGALQEFPAVEECL